MAQVCKVWKSNADDTYFLSLSKRSSDLQSLHTFQNNAVSSSTPQIIPEIEIQH